jgi:CRISPR/Cas system-associated exonuclease Cas4 (RecB family)
MGEQRDGCLGGLLQGMASQPEYVRELGLRGYISMVYNRGNEYVPVMEKQRGDATSSRRWDRAQAIATCLLVEEHFDGHVPFGVLLLSGTWERIPMDAKNRSWVQGILRRMRGILRRTELPARPNKCVQCRVRDSCWEMFPVAGAMQ